MKLARLKIAVRIYLFGGLFFAAMLIIGAVGWKALSTSDAHASEAMAIAQMDGATQQNAALVEQAAAAAESLRQQAGELAQAVSVFKTVSQRRGTAAPARGTMPVAIRAARLS